MTRLAVFFYQQLPDVAGPVRSMRASDIGIVKPAHGVIVASGAAPPTLARMKRAKGHLLHRGRPGLLPRGQPQGAVQPDGAHARARQGREEEGRRPGELPAVGQGGRLHRRAAGPKHRRDLQPFAHDVLDLPGGKYLNQNSNAAQGDRFVPDSVLVLRVRQGDAGYRDPAGNKVPETLYFGKGPAMLFHKGQVVRGTWKKTVAAAPGAAVAPRPAR